MTLRLILLALVVPLAACAHMAPPLPGCDGASRRPANPHGSILIEAEPAAPIPPETTHYTPGGCA